MGLSRPTSSPNLGLATDCNQCSYPIFKVLFVGQASCGFGNSSVAVDEETLRHEAHATIFVCDRGISEHDLVLYATLSSERSYLLGGSRVVHCHSDELESLHPICFVQLYEPRHFHAARHAPSRPKIQEDGLASQVR